jgi:hypothetical protein
MRGHDPESYKPSPARRVFPRGYAAGMDEQTDDATGEAIASGLLGVQAGPRLPLDGTTALAGGFPTG